VITTRVAFAGLSRLCEDTLRSGIAARPDIEIITPWTQLPLLGGDGELGRAEMLFIELEGDELPPALRVLMVAAEPLKIVGISGNARRATVFSMLEQRATLLGVTETRLWRGMQDVI
jgi:hypothetical protein